MARTEAAQRLCAYLLGLGMPAAVLAPLLSGASDSFPLSTYPMFAQSRGELTLYSMVAVAGDGHQERLPPSLLGTKEVLQAKVLIQRSVDGGPDSMGQLCSDAAARVAAAPDCPTARALAIVQRRYDPIAYFVERPAPLAEQRIFECALPARSERTGESR
jgi:hypothetical protein